MNRRGCIEAGFAIGAAVLGTYMLVGSSGIDLGSGYDRIGPRFFPYLVAAGLLISSGIMLFEVLRNRPDAPGPTIKLKPLVLMAVALVLTVLLLDRLGFVPVVSILFFLVARAFGSRRTLRDILIGLFLSASVYFIFTNGLGLVLPKGILSGII